MLEFFEHDVTSCPLTFEMLCFFYQNFKCPTTLEVSNYLMEFLKFYSLYISLEFQILHQEEGFGIPPKGTIFWRI